VLAPGYYARQDTKGPVKVAMRSLGLTMILNLIVMGTLALTGRLQMHGMHALLALTNGVGALFNAAWLYRGLVRSGVLQRDAKGAAMIRRIVLASLLMAAVLWWFGGDLDVWLQATTSHRVLWLSALVAGGAATYFGSLWLLGARAALFRMQPPTAR
jgi:putative peptidoglycan lipid II flippase